MEWSGPGWDGMLTEFEWGSGKNLEGVEWDV